MIGFPYTYGESLTEKEASENFQEVLEFFQENPMAVRVGSFVVFTVLVPSFFNLEAFAVDDKLVDSLKSKCPSSAPGGGGSTGPTTIGIPRPRTNLQKGINTGAIGASIAVLCLNAMWLPTPIGVTICLAAFTGYVIPPAWTIIIRGIRAGGP